MAEASDTLKPYMALLEKQKDLLRKAKAQKGQKPSPALRRSRGQLDEEFTSITFSASIRDFHHHQGEIRTCFIGEAYPPCTLPPSSLDPIYLRDLRLETQHRGRVLIAMAFSEPNRMAAVQNAVEDELGDVERLAIYNLLPTAEPRDILPRGAIFAVKEPYYKRTADGGLFVRVDHPSDLVVLRSGNKMIPRGLRPRVAEAATPAPSLKEDGNAAFRSGNWQLADDHYSDALEASGLEGDDDLRRTLHRNRAGARLRLGRYELAIADALAAIIPTEKASGAVKDLNVKALYRAGRAAYEMGDFVQAERHLCEALELDTGIKETQGEVDRARKRLAEQETGDYDFSAMAKSATTSRTRLDRASFLRNTEVGPAGCRGRGLFATKPLKPGDIVLVEKAFYAAYPTKGGDISVLLNYNTNRVSMGTQALRLYGIVDKMLWNPTLARQYLDLFDGGKFGSSKETRAVDGKVAVDTFQVQSIADLNGFACPRVKSSDKEERAKTSHDDGKCTGVWLQASYSNHSCLPNTARAFVGDMMIVRAVRDIAAAEEILMGYTRAVDPLDERRKRLKEGYGFECSCGLCQADAKVHGATARRRARLSRDIGKFLSANNTPASNARTAPPAQKTQAKKLLEEIRQTYPHDVFQHLPRLGCVGIGLWVGLAGNRAEDDLGRFLAVLRDTGIFVTIEGSDVTIDRGNALLMAEAIYAAMHAAQALRAMGNETAAAKLEALARHIYVSMYGIAEGFDAGFGTTS